MFTVEALLFYAFLTGFVVGGGAVLGIVYCCFPGVRS